MKLRELSNYRKAIEKADTAKAKVETLINKDVEKAAKLAEDISPEEPAAEIYIATVLSYYGMLRDLLEAPADGEVLLEPETEITQSQFEVVNRELHIPVGGIFNVDFRNHPANPNRSLDMVYDRTSPYPGHQSLAHIYPTSLERFTEDFSSDYARREFLPKAIATAGTIRNICEAAGVEITAAPTLEEVLPAPITV